ncbi:MULTISPECIES: hypothetical protein [Xenorhabdus]|uniref:hypothetical protein n=1 Tax=Xenorhabdus TaxID=626 RepID=UPI0006AA1C75|nr:MULTISPECIES: hypothetical protein [Xenorhabdus]KOP35026.1 hypothetical protein AFK69_01440 [Xenorhabdus sp. GDc328]
MKKILLYFILCFSGSLLTGCISGSVGGTPYSPPEKKQEPPLMSTIDFSKADYGLSPSNYKKLVKDQFNLVSPQEKLTANWRP